MLARSIGPLACVDVNAYTLAYRIISHDEAEWARDHGTAHDREAFPYTAALDALRRAYRGCSPESRALVCADLDFSPERLESLCYVQNDDYRLMGSRY